MDPLVTVERLTPAHRERFFRLFDAGVQCSVATASCCCHFCHIADAVPWETLDSDANRIAMNARIACGEMEGYLAFAGDRVVGWMNAQPKHKFVHPDARTGMPAPPAGVAPHASATIACIVVAREFHGRNVERMLLDAALLDLRTRGVRFVDAFPPAAGAGPHEGATRGTLELYVTAGFEPIARNADVIVVRHALLQS